MRIQESTVQLSASHEASSTHTLMSETTLSFPNLFKQLSTTEAAPTDNTEAQLALLERVRKMMYLMLETILAAMVRIPAETGQRFRRKLDTDSG